MRARIRSILLIFVITLGACTSYCAASERGLVWSSFLGGGSNDYVAGGTSDSSGNIYVAGHTWSSDFPTSPGAYQTVHFGWQDGIVSKLDPSGATLLYSSLIGGSQWEQVNGICLDGSGEIYLTGWTSSANFPTTPGAYDTSLSGAAGGNPDAFVTKLNASGTALVYSTFLGDTGNDQGTSIKVSGSGVAVITGYTSSLGFPATSGAYETTYNGGAWDVFVTAMNSAGTGLVFSTYLGGSDQDVGYAVMLDPAGEICVAGPTSSSDFPTTGGAFDTSYGGGDDAFVAKLSADGASLVFSTFIGGGSQDGGRWATLDADGNVLLSGWTTSSDFPTTQGAFDRTLSGTGDAYVLKLDHSGSKLVFSTLFGGSGGEGADCVGLDASGHVCIAGTTSSADMPVTALAYDPTLGGPADAYLAILDPLGASLCYSTYLGGSGTDNAPVVVPDSSGSVYVCGVVRWGSAGFPVTPGAYDTTPNGGDDVFVAKFGWGAIAGRVTFAGRTNHRDYAVISLKDTVSGAVSECEIMTDTAGNYTIANVPVGTYHVRCWRPCYLSKVVTSVVVPSGAPATANFLDLCGGDQNADNRVNALDVAGFSACYGGTGQALP